MSNKIDILLSRKQVKDLPKKELEERVLDLQEEITEKDKEITEQDKEITEKDKEITEKDKEIRELQKKLKESAESRRTQEANVKANQPSSKQPEWDKNGDPIPKGQKKKKNGGRRKGSGNKKKDLIPTEKQLIPLDFCPDCRENLQDQPVFETRSRIIEDIPAKQNLIVSEEMTERKWCPSCAKIVSSRSEKALASSDYGLNTLVLCAYFWVLTSISFPNINKCLSHFWGVVISTSGISRMMVRLGHILEPIYEEILMDVKSGFCLWADETGWRIRSQLHWLWAFSNKDSTYYWIDKSRGSDVVNRVLGEIFFGILIADGWSSYNQLAVIARQTCMPHIYRKIRKYIEAHPQFRSILKFYNQATSYFKGWGEAEGPS